LTLPVEARKATMRLRWLRGVIRGFPRDSLENSPRKSWMDG
jgi:hypothetical protein